MIEEQLHTYARECMEQRKDVHGARLVKKFARFNDIVAVGLLYGRMSEGFNAEAAFGGVRDAVDACFADSPMHDPSGGPDAMVRRYAWMAQP